ncbi:MAG: hypothetical protein Q9213_000317 [Squamulea squamosa]
MPPTTRIPFHQLLSNNRLRVIQNPLRCIPEGEVEESFKSFHAENHLSSVIDSKTLVRGAHLAARGREAFTLEEDAAGDLTEVEKAAIQDEEKLSIWTECREVKIINLTCFLGSIVQGWVQGAIVAANQVWPGHLGLTTLSQAGPTEPTGLSRDVWAFAATNAIVYFAASSVGAFLCDPITEIFAGRRRAIFVAALFTFIASVGEAFVSDWKALFAWRFSFIPALLLLLFVFVGSESPRWLIKKERYNQAYIVLLRLRGNPLLAARDLVLIWAQLRVETIIFSPTDGDIIDLENRIPYLDSQVYRREIGLSGYARRITQLFTIPRARRATFASFVVMIAQQMTGVNVFAFLASTLFEHGEQSGKADRGSLWLFFGFGVANFLSSTIGYFYIDSKGRRWLLMLSLAAMFPFLLATAFSFTANNPPQQGLVATFLVLYTIAYSPGAGVVPFLYSSEIFPLVLREVGMAWASAVSWMGAGILCLCVPALIRTLGQTGLLCLFAGLDALALCLVWLFAPGTGRQVATMEDMNYIFGVATSRHVQYQIRDVAPYCVDHYIRRPLGRQKGLKLEDLYHHATEDTNETTNTESQNGSAVSPP